MTETKLLIATDCFLPRKDGIARFLQEMLPSMKKVFTITIIAPDFPGSTPKNVQDGVNIIRVPIHSFKMGDFYPAKSKYSQIKKAVQECDVVWSHTVGPIGAKAIIAAHMNKKPVVAFIHSIENELVVRGLNLRGITKRVVDESLKAGIKYLYNRCYQIICPSKHTADVMKSYGITTKKSIVNLGVNTDAFSPVKDKDAAKRRIGLSSKQFVVGYCGRIAHEKNLETLKRAFDHLKDKHKNLHLLIVGDGPKEQKQIFSRRRDITITGFVDNVAPFLNAMDVYVLPSLTETTSLTTMEAMACALPVIVTPVGFMRTYVENGYNGKFFPKKDIEALANSIEQLYNNPRLKKELGSNARKTITKTYKWTKTAREIITILRRVGRETAEN